MRDTFTVSQCNAPHVKTDGGLRCRYPTLPRLSRTEAEKKYLYDLNRNTIIPVSGFAPTACRGLTQSVDDQFFVILLVFEAKLGYFSTKNIVFDLAVFREFKVDQMLRNALAPCHTAFLILWLSCNHRTLISNLMYMKKYRLSLLQVQNREYLQLCV